METPFTDVMVDIETTGVDPSNNAMIQLSAVQFNLDEMTVNSGSMFDRCLAVPYGRFWDEDTRQWWSNKRSILNDIYFRMEDPETVMRSFADWSKGVTRFWAKPTTFDFMFVASYFKQFGVMNPYDFRWATDVNSFIRGLAGTGSVKTFEVDFQGEAHNALHDVLNQINMLFKAKEHYNAQATIPDSGSVLLSSDGG